MLRVVSLNANGLRSAFRKGFLQWLLDSGTDVVCLQEIKAHVAQLDEEQRAPPGYLGYFGEAEKRGYSGVAIYSRLRPDRIRNGLGWAAADREGRYLQADFGDLSVASVYLPSGSSGPQRQAAKFEFMERFVPALRRRARDGRRYILCGDWNIAHRKMDLKNWRGNQKNSGFLPEERAWMNRLFGPEGWCDAFRQVNTEEEQYTWWSNRGRAWEKNVGWRIDYQVVSPSLADKVARAEIYKRQRFSDHAPLILDYRIPLPSRRLRSARPRRSAARVTR